MAKLMAVLRTIFLVFVVLYAFSKADIFLFLSSTARRGEVMVPFLRVEQIAAVTWVAIGWIALEVVIGWAQVWVGGKLEARRAAKAAAPKA